MHHMQRIFIYMYILPDTKFDHMRTHDKDNKTYITSSFYRRYYFWQNIMDPNVEMIDIIYKLFKRC